MIDNSIKDDEELAHLPKTERELFKLQRDYLKNRDTETFRKMFSICLSYARSMLLKMNRGLRFEDAEIIDNKAVTATVAFMQQYINKPTFYIQASFAGDLRFKVIEAKFKNYIEETHASFEAAINQDDPQYSIENNLESIGFTNFMNSCTENQYAMPDAFLKKEDKEVILQIIDEVTGFLYDEQRILALVYLYLIICLKRPKNRHSKKMFMNEWGDFKTARVIERVMLELRNRLKEID